MSNIEKIRQEIERRKKRWMLVDLPLAIGRYYEDRDILAFIDSLPEDDLPKTKGWLARNKDESLVFCYHKPHRENSITLEWWGSCDADFRIYDDAIDEQFKDLKWEDEPREVELIFKCGVCKDSLQAQETCKENTDSFTSLEEAAEEYAIPFNDTTYGCEYSYKGFIAGAKWQAKQLLKDSSLDGSFENI